jgi:hypothetical protein
MPKRRDEMDVIDERALVYMAVLFVCSALAVFAGPARAAATFGLVTASVEGAYWIGNALARRYGSADKPCDEGETGGRYAH